MVHHAQSTKKNGAPSTKFQIPNFKQTMLVQNNNFNLQNVWQINTRKSSVANALLENDALYQSKRPIILITEPYSEKGIAAFTTDRLLDPRLGPRV
jgi:hypothetical protein